ncbi:MAG: hypothetical protein H6679_03895 [Epsilonproteobacteria bacterium]|nr:hypothetical protein [Campylobacterota bacterium]
MNKLSTLLLTSSLVFSGLCLRAENVEVPDWNSQLPALEASLTGLKDALSENKATYTALDETVVSLFGTMQARHEARQGAFDCVRKRWKELLKDRQTCVTDTQALVELAASEKLALQSKLESLRKSTETEISDLEKKKADAEALKNQLQDEYDAAVGDSQEDAARIMGQLIELSGEYDCMIDAKKKLLKDVNTLKSKVEAYDTRTDVATKDINTEICGATL